MGLLGLKRKGCIVCVMLICGGQLCVSQDVVINEVMQSNVDYLMVDNDFPDSWVELYNPSEEDINIQGYGLGINNDVESSYKLLSQYVLPSKGHVVLYCDKENRDLHTNFRVDSGKGALYLFDEKELIIDELHLKKMPCPNIAFGRKKDGEQQWIYEASPTAGECNNGLGAETVLPDPELRIH